MPFLLEAGYSARDGGEHEELLAELLALPYVAVDRAVERRALDTQSQLRAAGTAAFRPSSC